MPSNHSVGLNDGQGGAPIASDPGKNDPQETVGRGYRNIRPSHRHLQSVFLSAGYQRLTQILHGQISDMAQLESRAMHKAELAAQTAAAQEFAPEQAPGYYPPALTGLRDDHVGSFEAAHDLRDTRSVDLSSLAHANEDYDLVVVGAGMSGLSAAYFFLKNTGWNVFD